MTGQVTTERGAGNRVLSLWLVNQADDTLAILCDECAESLAKRLSLRDRRALGLGVGWESYLVTIDRLATYEFTVPFSVHTPACDFQGGEL